jgi:hypothetical protein
LLRLAVRREEREEKEKGREGKEGKRRRKCKERGREEEGRASHGESITR